MSDVTPSVRAAIAAMIVLACGLTAVGVVRVSRQHEVLRLGYELSRQADRVRELREMRSRLELERATLTAPDRIRRLAVELGMTTVAPDRIRIVELQPAPPPSPIDPPPEAIEPSGAVPPHHKVAAR